MLWGRSSPQLPNPGAQSRIGQSSSACAVPGEQPTHLSAAALWLVSGPCWICAPKAVWQDVSVPLPVPQGTLFPAQTLSFSPLLGGAGTSPSNLEAQPWKPAKLPAGRRGAGLRTPCCRAALSLCPRSGSLGAWEGLAAVGWGDMEQSPQNIGLSLTAEPCSAKKQVCRALLPCSYGSTSQEGHLPCCCSPRGVTGHPWLWGTGSAAGWEGKWLRRESLGVVLPPFP